ncbi:MAG: universal stress protein [Inquilinus sp.]|nr:universal stress protein [Inquilinus sp.]
MALKDILVVVDDSKAAAGRAAFAAGLAAHHDAHLTGLFVIAPQEIPAYVMAQIPAEARRVQAKEGARKAAEARQTFEQAADKAGFASRSEWLQEDGVPTERTAMIGRYADLIVAGQAEPEAPASGRVEIAELVLSGGRPVLVVPYAFRPQRFGEHVLIAWNGSREAARAVADAMPILEAAKRISVLAVDPPDMLGHEPGADIARHIARHDVEVEVTHEVSHGLDPADALLNRVTDLSADMVVMGAYGRSRFSELVLGGVTRHILQHMTVPVLMSH